jgi:hypothetical protein
VDAVLVGFGTVRDSAQVIDPGLIDQMVVLGINCKDTSVALMKSEFSPLTSIYKQLKRYKLTEQMKDLAAEMKKLRGPAAGKPKTARTFPQVVCPTRSGVPGKRVRVPSPSVDVANLDDWVAAGEREPGRRMSQPVLLRPQGRGRPEHGSLFAAGFSEALDR